MQRALYKYIMTWWKLCIFQTRRHQWNNK